MFPRFGCRIALQATKGERHENKNECESRYHRGSDWLVGSAVHRTLVPGNHATGGQRSGARETLDSGRGLRGATVWKQAGLPSRGVRFPQGHMSRRMLTHYTSFGWPQSGRRWTIWKAVWWVGLRLSTSPQLGLQIEQLPPFLA